MRRSLLDVLVPMALYAHPDSILPVPEDPSRLAVAGTGRGGSGGADSVRRPDQRQATT